MLAPKNPSGPRAERMDEVVKLVLGELRAVQAPDAAMQSVALRELRGPT